MSYRVSLGTAKKFEAYAKERGVSKVARGESRSLVSDMGFFEAFKKVNGDFKVLESFPIKQSKPKGQTWAIRRNAFCKRHKEQMRKNKRPKLEKSGKYKGLPTRQETALIMWACSNLPEWRLKRIAKRLK